MLTREKPILQRDGRQRRSDSFKSYDVTVALKSVARERTVVEVIPAEVKFCYGGNISSNEEMTSLK